MVRFDQPEREEQQDWKDYSPAKALAAEEERKRKEAEEERLAAELESINREAREESKYQTPPKTVRAFRNVYGHWPKGWPPWDQSS